MIHVTPSAAAKLQALLLEHPDEAIVRVALKDLDDQRLVFSLTLEAEPLPEDAVYEAEGVTIVVAADSIPRIEGITLDYDPRQGFCFRHPTHQDPISPDEGPDGSGLEPFSRN
jgi:Fe-S cluster assembly iron-binding protein IscA